MSTVGIIFYLVLIFHVNACFDGRCRHEDLRSTDCTSVGLTSVPWSESSLKNFTLTLLCDNNCQHISFTALFKMLPSLEVLDVHENNALLCQDVIQLQSFKDITIISHCHFQSTHVHGLSSTSTIVYTTHETEESSQEPTFTTPKNHTKWLTSQISTTKISSGSNQFLWYNYVLITNLVTIPAAAILTQSILRVWKSRL